MSITGPPHKFKNRNGKIYWNASPMKDVDVDSFEPLNFIWSRDKNRVYSYGSLLRGADRETFTVLNALFAKDKDCAYYLSGTIKEADVASFRALDRGWFVDQYGGTRVQGYAADDKQVFHHVLTIGKPRIVKAADVASFRVLEKGFACDKTQVYYEGVRLPKANPETFRVLGYLYSTDDKRVFYGNTEVRGADPKTFQVGPDEYHGFDAPHKYDRFEQTK